jgi:signal transduction histidine kinase
MITKRSVTVYGLLAAVWALICIWQSLEHGRAKDSARAALLNRARDISNSVGVVIRSQRRFGGFVEQPRLEAALEELTESSELLSVVLLNSAYEEAASAGEPITQNIEEVIDRGELWTRDRVIVPNLVDLGLSAEDEGEIPPATIVVRPPDSAESPEGEGPPPGPMPPPMFMPRLPLDREKIEAMRAMMRGDELDEKKIETLRSVFPGFDEKGFDALRALMQDEELDEGKIEALRSALPGFDEERFKALRALMHDDELDEETIRNINRLFRGGRRGEFRRGRRGRPPFRRPPWMSEEQYQELVKKQGVHAFVLAMSTGTFRAECTRDLWLRIALGGIALVAAAGLGVAWHNLERSAELQMRLVRASEMNLQLQEMNVAAAGLAHETRNPLNTIRGLAQMISKQANAPEEIREKSSEIAEEVDRVTGRLNQFIDYSRPPEVRPAPTNIKAVIGDVASALESDIEDKSIQFDLTGPELVVEADESLLRQVLFNLMLNSIQAVDHGGKVAVFLEKDGPDEAAMEVRDNGPGVPEDARGEIFRPYYTASEQGTGLGLAVVRQIVLAHQWEIAYIPGEDGGARFRVSGLKVT